MAQEQSPLSGKDDRDRKRDAGASSAKVRRGPLFEKYKAEQGKTVRIGTFVAVGAILAWGVKFLYDQLAVYEDIEAWWGLLITTGIPILALVATSAVAWWFIFAQRATGDFMIATEGEMKKVNWSTKREVIGSTKVVIMFTVLLAVLLFAVDLAFQSVFRWLNVLKV